MFITLYWTFSGTSNFFFLVQNLQLIHWEGLNDDADNNDNNNERVLKSGWRKKKVIYVTTHAFRLSDTHTNLSLNIPYLAPEVYTVPFTISDSSSPPRSTFINLPGNIRSPSTDRWWDNNQQYTDKSHTVCSRVAVSMLQLMLMMCAHFYTATPET